MLIDRKTMGKYSIYGGKKGNKRLEILSGTIRSGTTCFLEKAGLKAGMNCLDLGCGMGDVTLAIAKRIGDNGHILGVDIDRQSIQLALGSAELSKLKQADFKVYDAYELDDKGTYDMVYSRFLLSHLSNPKAVLQKIWLALKPKGKVLIEDTDFSGHFSNPLSIHFNSYVSLYQRLLEKRGADANLGQKLVWLLKEAGFVNVEFQISQPTHIGGKGKLMAEITFDGISKALIEEDIISIDQAKNIHSGLVNFRKRNDSLMSLPRIFQVSATRP